MLRMGSISVRGVKCECRGNVMSSASCQLIDASNNTLVDFFLARKISIEGVNGRNGVNGETGTIRGHVGNHDSSVN